MKGSTAENVHNAMPTVPIRYLRCLRRQLVMSGLNILRLKAEYYCHEHASQGSWSKTNTALGIV